MEQNALKNKHSLTIRDLTTVTGVKSVISLGDKEVRLALEEKTLILVGRSFSAESLSLEEGTLLLSGEVESLRYAAKTEAKGFLKRLLK